MIIDLYKYVKLMLPPRLRVVQLIEFVRVLTAQIPRANYDFDLFLADANYRVNVNASKIALEHLISYELDAIAEIEELDGKPFDFIVNVYGSTDEQRLKALLDGYKLAGKSYTFRLGDVVYTAEWGNHVCEDIVEAWSAEWSDYVCEDDKEVNVVLFLGFAPGGDFIVYANASKNVASDITIEGNIIGVDNASNVIHVNNFSVTINSGSQDAQVGVTNSTSGYTYNIDSQSVSISPSSDAYYNYNLNAL